MSEWNLVLSCTFIKSRSIHHVFEPFYKRLNYAFIVFTLTFPRTYWQLIYLNCRLISSKASHLDMCFFSASKLPESRWAPKYKSQPHIIKHNNTLQNKIANHETQQRITTPCDRTQNDNLQNITQNHKTAKHNKSENTTQKTHQTYQITHFVSTSFLLKRGTVCLSNQWSHALEFHAVVFSYLLLCSVICGCVLPFRGTVENRSVTLERGRWSTKEFSVCCEPTLWSNENTALPTFIETSFNFLLDIRNEKDVLDHTGQAGSHTKRNIWPSFLREPKCCQFY